MNKRKLFAKKIEDELDFDFHADIEKIETIEDFELRLLNPFEQGKQIYYRGERKNSIARPLLPTIYREREFLFNSNKTVALVDNQALYNYYQRQTSYFELFEKIIGVVDKNKMYSFLAFSQHYFGISPLLDFSKSLYVALSFALKDRKKYDNDILIYTLEIKDKEDYTDSIEVADKWIENYSVLVFRDLTKRELESPLDSLSDYRMIADKFRGHNFLDMNTPHAKLIDVPANDLIRYQQGVFLLLDDFSLMGKSYLTKKIRDDFKIKKWLINKDICPELLDMLLSSHPYYAYKYIMDLSGVVSQIRKNSNL
ncbi:MAG: FRG domain-containing protein [Eubacterium sp.]